ncbi:MAG: alpha-L-arabinofuranosidase C-terminal domain-containing protein [Kiritimatiellia bacterium]
MKDPLRPLAAAMLFMCASPGPGHAAEITVGLAAGKAISPNLVGVFFEDLSYAADGGLYAELVQNRSFDYSPADRPEWNALTSWSLLERDGGKGGLTTGNEAPLHPDNPTYAVLEVSGSGAAGMQNHGFDGMPVKAGECYEFSVFARPVGGSPGALTVRLEDAGGGLLASADLPAPADGWHPYTATLKAAASAPDARLVLLAGQPGRTALDMISLFPAKTFKNRPNGLRADLAQAIADLHPAFMRFPGGCLVHGDGLANMYRWKDTIGPVWRRKGQSNIWRYHQSVGLGYFEYFQFCEDIGAMPLPVVPAGVCCQNSNFPVTHTYGTGQSGLPLEEMPAYVRDVLDLVEYANGPVTSTWGARRAEAGHPEPFHLRYLGVGNEDKITPVFKERFEMIFAALKAKHPEITVIGTVGPAPDGEDFTAGWKIAGELDVPMVDEHYYKPPQWFWDNLRRYDSYDRAKSKVYLGEYAAHDARRRSTLRAAIAEAAYLTSLERNGDVVSMASYAPLLARRGNTHWSPNLIYFDHQGVYPTISYQVQQLFRRHAGDTALAVAVPDLPALAASCVRDSASGDVILKLVNGAAEARPLRVALSGASDLSPDAEMTVLAGDDPDVVNPDGKPPVVFPHVTTLSIGPAFDCTLPANSLTILRINSRSKT